MFVDSQHARARRALPFGHFSFQKVDRPTHHRASGDALARAQSAGVDAVAMPAVHATTVWLGGPLVRENPRETLPESPPTVATPPLPALHLQHTLPHTETVVPRPPQPLIL